VGCTLYQLWSYDVAVAESNMGIFMQSRRNIRNCALFGNFSFYFLFSAEKELLLTFRLFFGRKNIFHFRWFHFFGRKRKIYFWSTSIRRQYFTGYTHYTRIGLCIPRFSQTVTNLQFSADFFLQKLLVNA